MDHREAERKVEEGTKEGDKGHGRRPGPAARFDDIYRQKLFWMTTQSRH